MGIMDDIVGHMRTKPSEELIGIYLKNDRIEWSDAAFEAIRQVLTERGVPLPQQTAGMVTYGKFQRVRLKPMVECGHYRGRGFLQVKEDGLRVSGRHVRSAGWRWGWGLALSLGIVVANPGGFVPGFVPAYVNVLLSIGAIALMVYELVEFGGLKSTDTVIPFSDITTYVADSKRHLIAIDFRGDRWSRPVVLRTQSWQDLLAVLRQKVPDQRSPAGGLPPASEGSPIP